MSYTDDNPIYNRECDDPFVYCDLYDKGPSYFEDALKRIDSVFVPTQSDWHQAMEDKKSLEKHGYKLNVGYPFEVGGGFHNIYERYLVLCGYEDETDYVEDLPF
jgi:hypothetical protein